MPNYRRIKIAGGCFFFTVCLSDRRATTLVDHIDDLKAAWRWTQERRPFACPAWVVLPDHIHCIWKLPPDDDDYSIRWLLLKRHFTRALIKKDNVKAGNRYGECAVWQRRFWEHAIRMNVIWKITSFIFVAILFAMASSNTLKIGLIQVFMDGHCRVQSPLGLHHFPASA